MEYSSNDVKQLFRAVYTLVKQQDERKSTLTVGDPMANDFLEEHRQLVSRCVSLIFEDYETVGKKAREILWRKGYYDLIAIFKKHHQQLQQQWHNNAADAAEMAKREQRLKQGAERLLLDGINHLKVIVLRLAQIFNLDNVRYLVSYGLLEDYDDDLLVQESGCYENLKLDEERSEEDRKVIYTKQEVSFALESIHSLLTALGDLHRYYCEFGLEGLTVEENIKDLTAKYYWEAFKLNPKIGITHNQLGTLFNGRNYNLDSVYHYLYSLCCPVPFDCSDLNVNKIFQKNIRYLECNGADAATEDHSIREFVAKFLLVVDVFFYDKSVTDFTSLCHSVLIDFKTVLGARRKIDDEYFISDDFIFKIVSILFFCMYRAQINSSDKIYSLNAFMVALCCELMEYCTMAVEKYRVENVREDKKFRELYMTMYQNYDEQVRRSRQSSKENAETFTKDQKSSSGVEESNGSDEHSNKENEDNDVKSETSSKRVASRKKHARRRRKALSNETDSELSDAEDDSEFQLDTESEDDASSISSFDSYDDFSDVEDDVEDNVKPERKETSMSAQPKESVDEHDYDLETNNDEDSQVQLKFKKRYHKLNPNIIINFAEQERTMRSLMLLFDWLHTNIDILIGCYQSNPEFIHNIMKLLNHFNIDIFSNRYYFPRHLITVKNIRDDFRSLFEIRRNIPLQEDIQMKHFPIFEENQESLDWEANYRLKVSLSEMSFLRLMKMVDFGFALCKSKKFEYSFCPKSRDFSLKSKKVQKQQLRKKDDQIKRTGKDNNRRTRRRDQQQQQQEKTRSRRTNDDRDIRGDAKPRRNRDRNRQNNQRSRATYSGSGLEGQRSSQEADGTKVAPAIITKKGYLKNKSNILQKNIGSQQSKGDSTHSDNTGDERQQEKNINELMGQLWLRNEVKNLESKVKKVVNITMTPYLMLDSKCLTEYTSIVKNLVKTKKFVVLIPTAVLSDLDELKKHSDGARNAIKWLEYEFSKGNRFLRSQKSYEMLPMPLFKIPKKLDRDATVFYQIVQFCNHIVTNHPDRESTDIITYLSGDSLYDRKLHNSSYIGILEAIPVKFEQIVTFYSSYKRK